MMTIGGVAHISWIVASLILSVVLILVVAKTSSKVQTFIITTIGLTAVAGIFFFTWNALFYQIRFF